MSGSDSDSSSGSVEVVRQKRKRAPWSAEKKEEMRLKREAKKAEVLAEAAKLVAESKKEAKRQERATKKAAVAVGEESPKKSKAAKVKTETEVDLPKAKKVKTESKTEEIAVETPAVVKKKRATAKEMRERGIKDNELDRIPSSNSPPMTEEENAAALASLKPFLEQFAQSLLKGMRLSIITTEGTQWQPEEE